jgi:hypothetical protein
MKHIEMIVLSLLLVTRGGVTMAQTDSMNVKNDSITWRFGSLKTSVKKTEHSIDNDDVVGGITKGQ